MSKISLKPNSAGSANFEIAAPATNVDRTLTIPDDSGTLLYTDTNGDFSVDGDTFYVDSANDRVGIGTSSPANFSGLSFASPILDVDGLIQLRNGYLNFGGSTYRKAYIQSPSGTSDPYLRFGVSSSGTSSSASEAMRIDSSGDVLIGTTSLGNTHAYFERASVDRSRLNLGCSTTGPAGLVKFNNPNGTVGNIVTDGTSTSYNTSSDYRLKENVVNITDGIYRLKQLPVHRFNFIADPNTIVDGFIAHEAQQVVPEAVTGEKDEVEAIGNITDADGNIVQEDVTEPESLEEGQTWTQTGERPVYQGIDQAKLVPLLTAALQEAVEKIEALEARVETLEAK